MTASQERLTEYARLAVHVGLNLQPGQVLGINALLEHAPLVRAVASEAYASGAKYVDVLYTDQRVRRAHIQAADDDALDWSPPWLVNRLDDLGESGGALLALSGNPEPEVFADLDGARVGRARMRAVSEASLRLTDGLCNWSIVAYPNEGWANLSLAQTQTLIRAWISDSHNVVGKPFVFLRSPEGWRRREVELGVRSNVAAAVTAGLSKGDVVALDMPPQPSSGEGGSKSPS